MMGWDEDGDGVADDITDSPSVVDGVASLHGAGTWRLVLVAAAPLIVKLQ